MDLLFTTLTLILFVSPSLALVSQRARRPVAAMLGVTGVVLAAMAGLGSGDQASLEVTHSFAGYEGTVMVAHAYVVDRSSAPGWQWPGLCLLWVGFWALWSWRAATVEAAPQRPVAGPLFLAWSGSALILALQKLAAPAPLAMGLDLGPMPPFEVVLLPAMVAAAIGLARGPRGALQLVFHLTICVALAHLPLAIFGTLATKQELGTYLDVHTIDHIANPLTRVSTPLEPKSNHQLGWLVWAPQLLMWPAFTMLSAGGAGFAAWMLHRHPR